MNINKVVNKLERLKLNLSNRLTKKELSIQDIFNIIWYTVKDIDKLIENIKNWKVK